MSSSLLDNWRRWGLCKQSLHDWPKGPQDVALSVGIQGHRHHGLTKGGDRAAHGVNDQRLPIPIRRIGTGIKRCLG